MTQARRRSSPCGVALIMIIALALIASPERAACAESWSLLALVVVDEGLQAAGEDYSRRLLDAARDTQWSVALQLDNGRDHPIRQAVRDGRPIPVAHGDAARATDPDTHSGFFRWARETVPADRYAVVVFGHGVSASGRGWDGTEVGQWPTLALNASGAEPLRPLALAAAIRDGLGQRVDVLALDSCYGASLEVAWDLRQSAEVIVASPGRLPSAGLPWTTMFEQAIGADSSVELGRRWARTADGLVAIRSAALPEVRDSLRSLSTVLLEHIESLTPALTIARAECAAWGSEHEMLDLHQFCVLFADRSAGEAGAAARRAASAVERAIVSDDGAVTVPAVTGLRSRPAEDRIGGFNDASGWGAATAAYRDRQQDLMRRTFGDRRHDEVGT